MRDWLLDIVEPALLALEMLVARERDAVSFIGKEVVVVVREQVKVCARFGCE